MGSPNGLIGSEGSARRPSTRGPAGQESPETDRWRQGAAEPATGRAPHDTLPLPRPGSALGHRHVVPDGLAHIDLARASDLASRVGLLLAPLRDPAGQASEREQHREHVHREAHRLIDEAGVEVHVRVEFALLEVWVVQGRVLQRERDVQQLGASLMQLEDLVRVTLDDRRARVVILVDPVPEAHELDAGLAVLDLLDEGLDI